jgi:proton-dependent oligopeptide transporter, POT family
LYPRSDPRRDPGFTLFYVGINLGAALGALVAGWLGETYGWSYGFGAASLGMLVGLGLFTWGSPLLRGAGEPPDPVRLRAKTVLGFRRETLIYAATILAVPVVWQLIQSPEITGSAVMACGAITILWIIVSAFRMLQRQERERVFAMLFLMLVSVLFWALCEQAGSSLNLLTDERVDRHVLGVEVPASMFQSLAAIYVVLLGPFFAGLWTLLARRGCEPSTPAKFAVALFLVGLGFLILTWGATQGVRIPVAFIFLIYLLHTAGELCLSPVGLSAITRLSVTSMVGLMMGTWFLSISLGSYAASLIARATMPTRADPDAILKVYALAGWSAIGASMICLLLAPRVRRWMHVEAS